MNKATITANGTEYAVTNPAIEGWEVLPRQSSMVAFIAIKPDEGKIMFQWNNGICTIVSDVPAEIIEGAKNAASIGKFYHASVKGKYTESDTTPNSISEVKDDEGKGYDLIEDEIDW